MALPNLCIVQVDDRLRPLSKKKTLSEYMNSTGVVMLLEQVGVELKFGADTPPKYWTASFRTILPPPPGVAKVDPVIEFQNETFFLDDLELI